MPRRDQAFFENPRREDIIDRADDGENHEPKKPSELSDISQREALGALNLINATHFRIGEYVFICFFSKDNTNRAFIKLLQKEQWYIIKSGEISRIGSHPLNDIVLYDQQIPTLAATISTNLEGKFVLRSTGKIKYWVDESKILEMRSSKPEEKLTSDNVDGYNLQFG
eukprot:TRINITY_DN9484_c0_g2_i2.p1 TRINITY_DN9484_c0_g2~~TRINITY_DN9484_c0_g2_i2.p1  ORF type:complete len:168 (+),score=6.65 TRINITY_DN9484_c0_g2_i2:295-798(+)